MRTTLMFYMLMILLLSGYGYWLGAHDMLDTQQLTWQHIQNLDINLPTSKQVVEATNKSVFYLHSAWVFVGCMALFMYFVEKTHGRREWRRMNENKREARRRYYRRRAARRKQIKAKEAKAMAKAINRDSDKLRQQIQKSVDDLRAGRSSSLKV